MFSDDDELIQGLQIQAPTKDSTILEGVLKKKSPKGFIKAWQDRWIVLTRDGLFYYKAKDVKDVKLAQYQGAIPLRTIASIDPSRKGFRFEITLEEQYGRVFSFTAKTEQEVQKWVMQTTLAWKDVKDAEKASGVVAPAAPAAGAAGAGAKIWRNPNAQVKNTKSDSRLQGSVTSRNVYTPEMQNFFNSYKPLYKQLNPRQMPPQNGSQNQCEFSLQQVLSTLFSDFKVQSNEATDNVFGTFYILGNGHYQLTHRSYLLHCINHNNPYNQDVLESMKILRELRFPLFPTQIHQGVTEDSSYAIYHPPLRSNTDTLFCWLQNVKRFPEHIVQWILIHIIITLQLLHSHNILFHSLSPEFTYFDADGVVRIGDLLLSQQTAISSLAHNVPEYDPPEVVTAFFEDSKLGIQPNTENSKTLKAHSTAGDFWRLGVFLYELSTGLPPFRASDEAQDDGNGVYNQILNFKGDLLFPPFISPSLKDLIQQLLQPNPEKRLTTINSILHHPFMEGVDQQLYDITYLLTQAPKPDWIIEKIITPLSADETTPQNLTFLPDQPLVHRLHCHLLQARHVQNIESFSKLQLQVLLEPDSYKTRPISLDGTGAPVPPPVMVGGGLTSTGGRESVFFSGPPTITSAKSFSRLGNDGLATTLNIPIDESFTFDFVHPNNTSFWPDLVLEMHCQKRDDPKATAGTTKSPVIQQQQTSQNTLVGICTLPSSSLRSNKVTDGWFTFFNVYTMEPCGEIRLDLQWESEFVSLEGGVLNGLTDQNRLFAHAFGKIVPAPNKKLWSTIVDSSANPYDPPATDGDGGLTSIDLNSNSNYNTGPLPTTSFSAQASYSTNTISRGSGQFPSMQQLSSTMNYNGSGSFSIFQPSSPSATPSSLPRHTLLAQQAPAPPPVPALPPNEDNSPLPVPPPVPAPPPGSLSSQQPPIPPPVPPGAGSPPPPVPPVPPPVPGQMLPPPVPTGSGGSPNDPESVMSNWKQTVDKATGAIYYYNRVTKAVSWTPPEGF